MVSHNKEEDKIVKTHHFPADKNLIGLPSNAYIYTSITKKKKHPESEQKKEEHGCIAYIPILDIVETRDIILSYNISDVQRHGHVG